MTTTPQSLRDSTAALLRSGSIDDVTALALGLVISASAEVPAALERIAGEIEHIENPPPSQGERLSTSTHERVSTLIRDLSIS